VGGVEHDGRVSLFNESGLLKQIPCATAADYERELNAAARWIDNPPEAEETE
jgi:hypothetical protein